VEAASAGRATTKVRAVSRLAVVEHRGCPASFSKTAEPSPLSSVRRFASSCERHFGGVHFLGREKRRVRRAGSCAKRRAVMGRLARVAATQRTFLTVPYSLSLSSVWVGGGGGLGGKRGQMIARRETALTWRDRWGGDGCENNASYKKGEQRMIYTTTSIWVVWGCAGGAPRTSEHAHGGGV
jgi:hypothetical protein